MEKRRQVWFLSEAKNWDREERWLYIFPRSICAKVSTSKFADWTDTCSCTTVWTKSVQSVMWSWWLMISPLAAQSSTASEQFSWFNFTLKAWVNRLSPWTNNILVISHSEISTWVLWLKTKCSNHLAMCPNNDYAKYHRFVNLFQNLIRWFSLPVWFKK